MMIFLCLEGNSGKLFSWWKFLFYCLRFKSDFDLFLSGKKILSIKKDENWLYWQKKIKSIAHQGLSPSQKHKGCPFLI